MKQPKQNTNRSNRNNIMGRRGVQCWITSGFKTRVAFLQCQICQAKTWTSKIDTLYLGTCGVPFRFLLWAKPATWVPADYCMQFSSTLTFYISRTCALRPSLSKFGGAYEVITRFQALLHVIMPLSCHFNHPHKINSNIASCTSHTLNHIISM